MRVAYYSPQPPERSGIADYSALLLPALAERIDVDVIRRGSRIRYWLDRSLPLRGATRTRRGVPRPDLADSAPGLAAPSRDRSCGASRRSDDHRLLWASQPGETVAAAARGLRRPAAAGAGGSAPAGGLAFARGRARPRLRSPRAAGGRGCDPR